MCRVLNFEFERYAVGVEEPNSGDVGDGRVVHSAQTDTWRCEHASVNPGPRFQHGPKHQDRT